MKFNFGHGVLVVIFLFIAGMSTLVYKCTQQKVELVNSSYYAEELKYSEQMEKEKNTLALNEAVGIAYSETSGNVVVKYPQVAGTSAVSGEIYFFRPDNTSLDFRVPVQMNTDRLQEINSSKLSHGMWRVKINWQAGGTSYYNEKKIYIN